MRTRHDRVADPQIQRGNDIALFAIRIKQQRQASGAVRIVFDRRHAGRDVVLFALEIHHADLAAVTAAAVADGHTAIGIAPAAFAQGHEQGALGLVFGDFFEGVAGHSALTGSNGFDIS